VLFSSAKESSHYLIQAGVPQDSVWPSMLFNLYVHQLPLQAYHYFPVIYCDDSILLRVVPLREARKLAAEEINSDLDVVVCWCHIEFKPAKLST